MKLDRVQLDRYGPLAGVDHSLCPGIQLIHGPNESGKTLLVEGLLHLLTGQPLRDARVAGDAVGRVTVAGDDGEDPVTVDGERTLLDVYAERYGYDFTPAEFRNVFVLRDGDLDVEDGYYESVTDQLTGLRSEDIRTLQGAVRDLGRITEVDKRLKDSEPYGYPKTQRQLAGDLADEIDRYLASAREESLDAAERDLFEARREVREVEADVAAHEAALERQRVAELRDTLDTLEANLAERASLPPEGVVDGLQRDLDDLSRRAVDEAALQRRLDLYRPVAALAMLFAVLGVTTLLLVDLGRFGPLVPVVGVLVAAVAGVRWDRANRRLAAIERTRAEVLTDAREAGLEPDDAADLRSTVADVQERRKSANTALDQAVGELHAELSLDAREPGAVADAAVEAIEERAADLPDEPVKDLPDEPAADGPVDDESLAERREAVRAARQRAEERAAALEEHHERLDAFERRARELDFETFTGDPLDVAVTSLEALADVRERLVALVETIEEDARVARTTHDVLEGMAATEGEKVASLFGPDSRASEVFELVTGERYDAVRFDADADSLVAAGRDDPLAPGTLSQGTRDQLFFSVRVGLAEQLLGGQRGVLVLDDAFVTADPDRLDRQTRVLDRLARAGWQVLYLTAKADAIDRLGEHCPSPIELDPL